jgi:hypothetical protein
VTRIRSGVTFCVARLEAPACVEPLVASGPEREQETVVISTGWLRRRGSIRRDRARPGSGSRPRCQRSRAHPGEQQGGSYGAPRTRAATRRERVATPSLSMPGPAWRAGARRTEPGRA